MPVFDFIAFGKAIIRGGIIIGLVIFVASFANTLGNVIISLWSIVNNGVNHFNSLMSQGSSSGSLSCFFYYIHALGIDVALTSLITGVIGVSTAWASTIVLIMSYQVTIYTKNLLMDATK